MSGFFASGDGNPGWWFQRRFSRLQAAAPLDGFAGQLSEVFPVQRSKPPQMRKPFIGGVPGNMGHIALAIH
jgi:hypothetical protein